MSFVTAVRTCFGKYVTFSGRAPRSEFWWFILAVWLVSTGLSLVDGVIWGPTLARTWETLSPKLEGAEGMSAPSTVFVQGPLTSLWGSVTFLPALAASWRRLHDTGRPGWMCLLPAAALFIGFFGVFAFSLGGTAPGGPEDPILSLVETLQGPVTVLGAVVLLVAGVLVVFLCQRSSPGSNAYGPNPLEVNP